MVVNMSLGGGANDALDAAVRTSVEAGVTYAISAGNGQLGLCLVPGDAQDVSSARVGDDEILSDGTSAGDTDRLNGAVTTTASGRSDQDLDCNFGAPVPVAAPGDGIMSTWLDGGYNTLTGTSMAAPHAAGAAVLYLQSNPRAVPGDVERAIVDLLAPWTTDDLPNASGRLDVGEL